MKKLLLSLVTLASTLALHAQCNELFISEYVEGTGNDKAIEIYNPTNLPINLSNYVVARFGNGSSTWVNASTSQIDSTHLRGTIPAHGVWVLVNGQTTTVGSSPLCSPLLQSMADQLDHAYSAPTYMNGNDAIVLYNGSTVIDIFGKTGDAAMVSAYGWSDMPPYDGSPGSGKIWTENHTLVRKASVTQGVTTNPSPEFIVTTQWDSLPKDTWSGLGTHICTCATGIEERTNSVSVSVYPNPVNTGYLNISAGEPIIISEVYDVVGQKVISLEGNKNNTAMAVNTTALPKGIYFVRVYFSKGKTTTTKFSIQ